LTKAKLNEAILRKIAKNVLAKEKKQMDLSVAIVGSEEIKKLNKKYRKKDKPTDVLSFNYGSIGEVVICPEQVRGTIGEVLIHGILHILGYNHKEMAKLKYYG
jgi:probable rRNA maturation factor